MPKSFFLKSLSGASAQGREMQSHWVLCSCLQLVLNTEQNGLNCWDLRNYIFELWPFITESRHSMSLLPHIFYGAPDAAAACKGSPWLAKPKVTWLVSPSVSGHCWGCWPLWALVERPCNGREGGEPGQKSLCGPFWTPQPQWDPKPALEIQHNPDIPGWSPRCWHSKAQQIHPAPGMPSFLLKSFLK